MGLQSPMILVSSMELTGIAQPASSRSESQTSNESAALSFHSESIRDQSSPLKSKSGTSKGQLERKVWELQKDLALEKERKGFEQKRNEEMSKWHEKELEEMSKRHEKELEKMSRQYEQEHQKDLKTLNESHTVRLEFEKLKVRNEMVNELREKELVIGELKLKLMKQESERRHGRSKS
ncbi:hypothetical protein GYMLUDRAFT_49909 [Collybiopsis luxurians FD-317 M1]|uniref:Uncharacterized protein n=1 Tax=Collybiopsis luxurians FD-317 M1 TaxID=944289 RepID=A0A0D0AQ20_9AGAR|nr:hypothetical protein GYMLUDRAFT_49909 [Collybiopsis luxurians FD-317 M1]